MGIVDRFLDTKEYKDSVADRYDNFCSTQPDPEHRESFLLGVIAAARSLKIIDWANKKIMEMIKK